MEAFSMKNVKFGVFCLGLVIAVAAAVSSLSAQTQDTARGFAMLDGRGAELGVMVSDVTNGGVKVDEVHQASAAEKAGIKAGDIVVDFDGERVRSARQFTRLVQETPDGRSVAVGLRRDGKKLTVTATPEATTMTFNVGPEIDRAMREAERGMREFRFDMPNPNTWGFRTEPGGEPRRFEYRLPDGMMPFVAGRGRLGLSVQSLTPDLQEYFGAKNGGALVSSVTKESAAAKAGIKAGDVIVSINGKHVDDSDDLLRELDNADGDLTIALLRDKKEMTLKATIERRTPRPSVRG
ncbi:MAG: PDZ domain-containing protein [Acidobacteriota bacterium]